MREMTPTLRKLFDEALAKESLNRDPDDFELPEDEDNWVVISKSEANWLTQRARSAPPWTKRVMYLQKHTGEVIHVYERDDVYVPRRLAMTGPEPALSDTAASRTKWEAQVRSYQEKYA